MTGHDDLWAYTRYGLREDLGHAEQRIGDLEQRLVTAQKANHQRAVTAQKASQEVFWQVSDLMGGLREDLVRAEERIRDLEQRLATLEQRSVPEPGGGAS